MEAYWPAEYAELDFDLPENLIATHPVEPPDIARLMVVNRGDSSIVHDVFSNLGSHLKAGDKIFYNATQVEARRVSLQRAGAMARFECVFLKTVNPDGFRSLPPGCEGREIWQVLMRNIRRLKDGEKLVATKAPEQDFIFFRDDNLLFLASSRSLTAADFLQIGEMPLPPYMHRPANDTDIQSYQNFFVKQMEQGDKIQGSAASPTASLHFTQQLYTKLKEQDIEFLPVCLDIGYGTFAPLTERNFVTGKLHAEHYYIPYLTAKAFASEDKRKKIVIGTTALRALLSFRRTALREGETDLFVQASETINEIDGLITNFHLPRSSLLLLVAAFCGKSLLAEAYRQAVQANYRFYSYGDAMLIL